MVYCLRRSRSTRYRRTPPTRLEKFVQSDRKARNPLPRGMVNSVGDGGRNTGDADLPYTVSAKRSMWVCNVRVDDIDMWDFGLNRNVILGQ